MIHIIDESIFYLDVDSIIRGNVEDSLDLRKILIYQLFLEILTMKDLKLQQEQSFLKNNENSKRFINLWFNKISNIEKSVVCRPDYILHVFEELKENLNFKSLSKELNDWEFNPNSVIWSGKTGKLKI